MSIVGLEVGMFPSEDKIISFKCKPEDALGSIFTANNKVSMFAGSLYLIFKVKLLMP